MPHSVEALPELVRNYTEPGSAEPAAATEVAVVAEELLAPVRQAFAAARTQYVVPAPGAFEFAAKRRQAVALPRQSLPQPVSDTA